MAAVLLGIAWLDTLESNAEPDPPDRKFSEIPKRVSTREGPAVITANGRGEAVLLKGLFEDGKAGAF